MLNQEDKSKNLQAMWRNKAISDTYEPGSVFKVVTASAAIQEGIADSDISGQFNCSGSIQIAGARIKCRRPQLLFLRLLFISDILSAYEFVY